MSKKRTRLTRGPIHHDHLGVGVETLGRPVDEMVEVAEAQGLVGPGLEAGLQHPARLAVDVRLRHLKHVYILASEHNTADPSCF